MKKPIVKPKHVLLIFALIGAFCFAECNKKKAKAASASIPLNSINKLATVRTFMMSGNPILPLPAADPDILYANGKYYIYTTASGPNNSQFHAYSSTDLTNFVDEGVILDLANVTWAHTMGWAPSCVARNGKYYLYYTAELKIGVAVSASPTGPFVDKGSALATGTGPNPIDPMAFIDTDGQAYLYWGNTTFNSQKLNSDMISFSGNVSHVAPSNFFEASYVFKRNSTYYLCYSVNDYHNDDYHVEYATSSSLQGPWTTKGRLTSVTGNIKSPGHNAVIRRPGCSDEWYFVYARRTSANGDDRQVAIERMFFDSIGNIMPIDITTSGVIAEAGTAGCTVPNPIANGTYTIVSKLTTSTGAPLVLDIPACTTGTSPLETWTTTQCIGQRWVLTYADGFYKIVSAQPTHNVLDIDDCSLSPGARVDVWTDLNNDCQRWRIEAVGFGWYRLVSKKSGNVLDIAACNNAPGAVVQTWLWNAADCQLFKFQP